MRRKSVGKKKESSISKKSNSNNTLTNPADRFSSLHESSPAEQSLSILPSVQLDSHVYESEYEVSTNLRGLSRAIKESHHEASNSPDVHFHAPTIVPPKINAEDQASSIVHLKLKSLESARKLAKECKSKQVDEVNKGRQSV